MWRIGLLVQLLCWPDELLFSNWFGSPPQFSLVDRLPVLLVAGADSGVGRPLGWLLMVLCRRRSAGLDGLERPVVFAAGRGAQRPEHLGAVAGAVGGDRSDVDVRRAGDR